MASYDFDIPFQRNLLAAFLTDEKSLAEAQSYIKPDWFTDEVLGSVARSTLDFFTREHKLPDLAALKEEVKLHVSPGRKYSEYEAEVSKVWKRIGTNPDFYRGKAVDFARHQSLVVALGEAAELVHRGDLEGVEVLVRRALQVGGGGLSGGGSSFAEGLGERLQGYRDDGGVRAGADALRVPCGIGPLDRAIQGGLAPGELGVILGLAGHGKSSCLRQIGMNAVMSGKSVFHVSLENSEAVTLQMYDCCFYGKSLKAIKKRPERFEKAMTALVASLKAKLDVKYFPSQSLTLAQLEVAIESRPLRPQLVILDYAALLKPARAKDERRFDYAEIFGGLRALSSRIGIPIWTAHQANRPGVGSGQLGMQHVAECFEIAGIVDVGISVNWDEEAPALAELYVWKNRLGPSNFSIPCSSDWKISRIQALVDEEVSNGRTP